MVGGVKMQVANAPDFSVNYTAGILPLAFYVRSRADTTLLINLPDGTWIADDDSDGNFNPVIKLNRPQTGRYDIWVGTFNGGNPAATLYITELRQRAPERGSALVHVDIIDGKLWIQRDGTEHGIARDLLEAGVPREQIALAFRPPDLRARGA